MGKSVLCKEVVPFSEGPLSEVPLYIVQSFHRIGILFTLLKTGILVLYIQSTWSEGHKLAGLMKFKFPTMVSTELDNIVPTASSDGIQLMYQMLTWDPQKRITASQVGLPMVSVLGPP